MHCAASASCDEDARSRQCLVGGLSSPLCLRHSALHELGHVVRLFSLAIGRSSRCAHPPHTNQRAITSRTNNCHIDTVVRSQHVDACVTLHVSSVIIRLARRTVRTARCARYSIFIVAKTRSHTAQLICVARDSALLCSSAFNLLLHLRACTICASNSCLPRLAFDRAMLLLGAALRARHVLRVRTCASVICLATRTLAHHGDCCHA